MILDEICADKRIEVERAKAIRPLEEVVAGVAEAGSPRDFHAVLRKPGISLIAEIKKASPALGDVGLRPDPAELAAIYEDAGASAVSVLTDHKYFMGTLDDLKSVRQTVDVPCLRKEFIIDPYQIYEARAAGADAVLLIIRILTDDELGDFLDIAGELSMDVLVETHNQQEIERAVAAGARIIGINNRDLGTFRIDVSMTLNLKHHVPGGCVLVSESGIRTREDVRRLEGSGVDAVLIGEALVTSGDVRAKIHELLGYDES